MLDLLARVLLVAGLPGGVRERDDGVPVLACVVCKLVAGQLAATPALVERMLEHVPALAGGVDPLDQLHSGSPWSRWIVDANAMGGFLVINPRSGQGPNAGELRREAERLGIEARVLGPESIRARCPRGA